MWFYGLVKLEDIYEESNYPRNQEKVDKIALEISKNLKIEPIPIDSVENGKFTIIDGGLIIHINPKFSSYNSIVVLKSNIYYRRYIFTSKFSHSFNSMPPNLAENISD